MFVGEVPPRNGSLQTPLLSFSCTFESHVQQRDICASERLWEGCRPDSYHSYYLCTVLGPGHSRRDKALLGRQDVLSDRLGQKMSSNADAGP